MRRADDILPVRTRKAILAGDRPRLSWSVQEPCPVEPGDELGLIFLRSLIGPIPQVTLRITGVGRNKKIYQAEYCIRDDRPLYLRPGTGYTRIRSHSIDFEADVIDDETLARFANEGEQKTILQGATQRQRQELASDRSGLAKRHQRGNPGKLQAARIRRLERRLSQPQKIRDQNQATAGCA